MRASSGNISRLPGVYAKYDLINFQENGPMVILIVLGALVVGGGVLAVVKNSGKPLSEKVNKLNIG
jgi:hypothetical protein